MSDYNSNSSNRGNRGGRRRRGGKRRHHHGGEAYDSRDSYEPRAPKAAPPSGFQKFLSVISFGLLGKSKPVSKAYASGAPQPIRTPREPSNPLPQGQGQGNRENDRGERNRDRGERGDREQRREKREPRPSPVSTEVTGERLYVGNLSYDASESDLFELFNGSGQVKNAEVVVNNRTQRSKGFAFVTMMTLEDAKKAVADLNGKDFMGRPLVVGGAKPMTPREDREDRGDRRSHDDEEHHESSEHSAPVTSESAEEPHNANA
jgi:hypothetical protein